MLNKRNLKLGYGGTKSEMERLLADAQKLTGETYDISNLNDVYSAIHAIQNELGITGTTAKEAEGTISGSMNQMKASATNLLAALTGVKDGNGDAILSVKDSMSALVSSTVTFASNVIPAVVNIVMVLPEAIMEGINTAIPLIAPKAQELITEFMSAFSSDQGALISGGVDMINGLISGALSYIPQIMTLGNQVLTQLVQGIKTNFPTLLQGASEIITNIVNGIYQNAPSIISGAGEMIRILCEGIITMAPQIFQIAGELINNLVNGFIANAPAIASAAFQLVIDLAAYLLENAPSLIESGIELIVNIGSGLIEGIPDLLSNCWEAVTQIGDKFLEKDWVSIGSDIINGIGSGIASAVSGLVGKAIEACRTLTDRVKSFFGIASPSRKMRDEVGKWIPAGIAVGIDANTDSVRKSIGTMNRAIMDASGNYNINVGESGNVDNTASIVAILKLILKAIKDGHTITLNGRDVTRELKDMGVVFA